MRFAARFFVHTFANARNAIHKEITEFTELFCYYRLWILDKMRTKNQYVENNAGYLHEEYAHGRTLQITHDAFIQVDIHSFSDDPVRILVSAQAASSIGSPVSTVEHLDDCALEFH